MYVYTDIIFCRKTTTRKAMGWVVCVWWNPLLGMLWSQDGHHVAVDFGKHPLSRDLDLGTDTRGTWAIIPGKPQDQSNGLLESCAQWRNADEKDFSKETCRFHRFVVFPGEETWLCWKPAVLFFLYFFFFLFYFAGWGETDLKWNTSFWSVWPDWGMFRSFDWIGFKSIQNTLQLPSGKVQLRLFFFIVAVLSEGPRCPGDKDQLLCWLSPQE